MIASYDEDFDQKVQIMARDLKEQYNLTNEEAPRIARIVMLEMNCYKEQLKREAESSLISEMEKGYTITGFRNWLHNRITAF